MPSMMEMSEVSLCFLGGDLEVVAEVDHPHLNSYSSLRQASLPGVAGIRQHHQQGISQSHPVVVPLLGHRQ